MVVQQEWFTVREAAEYLWVSKRNIYKLCQENLLIGHRTSKRGHWRFRKEELDNVMKRGISENDVTGLVALNAMANPILAEVWNNDKDAAYDRI